LYSNDPFDNLDVQPIIQFVLLAFPQIDLGLPDLEMSRIQISLFQQAFHIIMFTVQPARQKNPVMMFEIFERQPNVVTHSSNANSFQHPGISQLPLDNRIVKFPGHFFRIRFNTADEKRMRFIQRNHQ
jgi:hypothetical protein